MIKVGQLWQALENIEVNDYTYYFTTVDFKPAVVLRHEIVMITKVIEVMKSDPTSFYWIEFLSRDKRCFVHNVTYMWMQKHFLQMQPEVYQETL